MYLLYMYYQIHRLLGMYLLYPREGYIVFAFPFVCSFVRSFVSSFVIPERSRNLCQSFC